MLERYLSAALLACSVVALANSALADESRPETGRSCPVDVDADVAPLCPDYLQYRPHDRVPHGYQLGERARRGPLVSGAVLFGLAYVPSLMVATGNGFQHGTAHLALPIFGPFAEYASLGPSCGGMEKPGCVDDRARWLLALDGLVQVGGGVLMLVGVSATRTVLIRNDLASVTIMPRLLPSSGYGATVVGTF